MPSTDRIRIDELDPTITPTLDHVVPAMLGGVTTYYTFQQAADLILLIIRDGAPEALDTLQELAVYSQGINTALSALTTTVAGKLAKSGGVMTGDLDMGSHNILNTLSVLLPTAQAFNAAQRAQIRANHRDRFTSTAQTPVAGGLITVAHGLASTPEFDNLFAHAICTTADFGFSVGQKSRVIVGHHSAAADEGLAMWADATNVYARVGVSGMRVLTRAGVSSGITLTSWDLYLGEKLE